MTYSLVGSALTHWKEHWPLYVGFTAAFWAYIIYKFALRVRFFSGMKSVPGPPHGHWFLGQIKAITGEAPGMAHLRWHRQVSVHHCSSRASQLISHFFCAVWQCHSNTRPSAWLRDDLFHLVYCTQDNNGRSCL